MLVKDTGGGLISNLQYGYDSDGIQDYLGIIKSQYLETAKEAVINTKGIVDCCDRNWKGTSKDNFVTNLQKDADHVSKQFDALYTILVSEVESVNAAMANKDETMIKVD